jgi:hypothetical protein
MAARRFLGYDALILHLRVLPLPKRLCQTSPSGCLGPAVSRSEQRFIAQATLLEKAYRMLLGLFSPHHLAADALKSWPTKGQVPSTPRDHLTSRRSRAMQSATKCAYLRVGVKEVRSKPLRPHPLGVPRIVALTALSKTDVPS